MAHLERIEQWVVSVQWNYFYKLEYLSLMVVQVSLYYQLMPLSLAFYILLLYTMKVGFLPVSPHRSQCNEPLSRAGSFLASTGLPPRSLLNDDTPVSICGFVSESVSSVRLLPARPPLFPNSRFVGNILALKVTEQEYIYSQSQRPPPYITPPPTLAPRTLIIIRSTVLLPGLQVPVGLR
ncbi:hypothetical protein T07_10719 [Trichinella nelsoni]|uniref:Uncharacterized protein n=1 Tax=Trichinella nelsoni TaxID=6336 RepID=A0A0V0SBS1_9BILA|nr:hypothetical protein T07_10719 [Trichinella nelsoni]